MKQTTYIIKKMDCSSEEQLIRMKLSKYEGVKQLDFDILNRKLIVYHTNDTHLITDAIDSLNLNSTLQESKDTDEVIAPSDDAKQRKLLWQVLLINFFFFILEIVTGFISDSMGLVADSMDMFADSIVYALALFAVGASVTKKGNIAKISGYMQLLLAILGFIEVGRRFLGYSEVPVFETMVIISLLALTGNAVCLYLLQKSRSTEAHMQASMIFTSNDIIVNLGVICAGILVYLTQSKIPDLVVGFIVFIVVCQGAIKILKL